MMDMDNVLAYATYAFPKMPLLVGVHSSASALMLNYLEWMPRKRIFGESCSLHLTWVPKRNWSASVTLLWYRFKAGMAMNKSTLGLACRHCKV